MCFRKVVLPLRLAPTNITLIPDEPMPDGNSTLNFLVSKDIPLVDE